MAEIWIVSSALRIDKPAKLTPQRQEQLDAVFGEWPWLKECNLLRIDIAVEIAAAPRKATRPTSASNKQRAAKSDTVAKKHLTLNVEADCFSAESKRATAAFERLMLADGIGPGGWGFGSMASGSVDELMQALLLLFGSKAKLNGTFNVSESNGAWADMSWTASLDSDGDVVVDWEIDEEENPDSARTDEGVRTFEKHADRHTGAVLSAQALSGQYIVSTSMDATVKLWNAESGRCERSFDGHEGPVRGVIALEDGTIVSFSDDATLKQWNPDTGECLWTMTGHDAPIDGVVQLPNGLLLSWASGSFRCWNVARRKSHDTFSWQNTGQQAAAALRMGYNFALAFNGYSQIVVFDEEFTREATIDHGGEVAGVRPLLNGDLLTWDLFHVWIWSTSTGACHEALSLDDWMLREAVPLTYSRVLLIGQSQGIRIWYPSTGKVERSISGDDASASGAIELEDGRLVTWTHSCELVIWTKKGLKPHRSLAGHVQSVKGALCLLDGDLLSWSFDGTLRIWDVKKGQQRRVLGVPLEPVNSDEHTDDDELDD